MSSLVLPAPALRWRGLSRVLVVVGALVVVVAMLGLYAIRPFQASSGTDDGFARAWSLQVQSYAAETARVQQQAATASGGDTAALLAVYRELDGVAVRAAADFTALEPPVAAADEVDAFVSLLERQHRTLQQVVRAASANDQAALAVQVKQLTALVLELVQARAAVDRALAA